MKWYFKKNAYKQARKHPEYYKDKKLVRTTKMNWDGEKRSAFKWVKK